MVCERKLAAMTETIQTLFPLLALGALFSPLVLLMERANRRAVDVHGTGDAHDREPDADSRRLTEDLRARAA